MRLQRKTQLFLACLALILAGLACSSPAELRTQSTSPPFISPVLPPATYTIFSTNPIDTQTPAPTPTLAGCQVATGLEGGKLNIRRCPGEDCAIIGLASEDDRLQLSPTQPDSYWLQVIGRNGAVAWIARRYCQEVEP